MWIHLPKSVSSLDTEGSPSGLESPALKRGPSATLRKSPIARGSSSNASQTDSWTMLPFGMTSQPSTGDHGVDKWILLLAVSRANRTALQDNAEGLLTTVISGQTPLESFGKWDPDASCWKMSQGLEPPKGSTSEALKRYGNSVYLTKTIVSRTQGASTVVTSRLSASHSWEQLAGSFPTSVSMRNGILYQLRPLVPRTSDGGGGAWPTPVQYDATPGGPTNYYKGSGNRAKTGMWPSPRAGKTTDENEETWLARKAEGKVSTPPLTLAVKMWPTPKGSPDHYGQPRENDRGDLQAAVLSWPTPTNSMMTMADLEQARFAGDDLATQVGGQLNPRWVEWLMGLPLGWVNLEPLATESFRQWWRSFCGDSAVGIDETLL